MPGVGRPDDLPVAHGLARPSRLHGGHAAPVEVGDLAAPRLAQLRPPAGRRGRRLAPAGRAAAVARRSAGGASRHRRPGGASRLRAARGSDRRRSRRGLRLAHGQCRLGPAQHGRRLLILGREGQQARESVARLAQAVGGERVEGRREQRPQLRRARGPAVALRAGARQRRRRRRVVRRRRERPLERQLRRGKVARRGQLPPAPAPRRALEAGQSGLLRLEHPQLLHERDGLLPAARRQPGPSPRRQGVGLRPPPPLERVRQPGLQRVLLRGQGRPAAGRDRRPERERHTEPVHGAERVVLEGVVDPHAVPAQPGAGRHQPVVDARAQRQLRQRLQLDAGVEPGAAVARLLDVARDQQPAGPAGGPGQRQAEPPGERVGDRLLVQADGGLDGVAQRQADREVARPGGADAGGQQRPRQQAEVAPPAGVAEAGQILPSQLERAADAPGRPQLPRQSERQFALRVGELAGGHVVLVARVDAVHAEAAEGEGHGSPAPVRQGERARLLAEAQADQVAVPGPQLAPRHARQPGRVPEDARGVVRDGGVGAAEGEGAVAGAVREDRDAAPVVGGDGHEGPPRRQQRDQQRQRPSRHLSPPAPHRSTATLRRSRSSAPPA